MGSATTLSIRGAVGYLATNLAPKCRECGRVARVDVKDRADGGLADEVVFRLLCRHGFTGQEASSTLTRREVRFEAGEFQRLLAAGEHAEIISRFPREIGWPTPPPGPEVP